MTRQRALLVGVASVLALALALSPVASTADPSARERREETRRQRAETASQLDLLQADNAELEGALDALTDHVATQAAQVDAARQAAEAAEAAATAARARVEEMTRTIAELRARAQAQAVEAYMNPGGAGLDEIMGSRDFNEAREKQALLDNVDERNADVLDQLRAAEEDLEVSELEARAAAEEAAGYRAEAEERLLEVEAARAEQARIQAALEGRIDQFQEQVDALEAEEDQLTAIIEREAAAAEARRRASSASNGDGGGSIFSEPAPGNAPASASGLIWPVRGRATSEFGPRWGRMHNGLDIAAPTGTPIWAAKAGEVIFVGQQGGYCNIVVVDHGGGFVTLYPHQSRLAARVGQSLSQGEVLGYVGCSGSCTGPHLHFETRVNGSAQNPRRFLP
ncbi:hypothetical protein BH20ACT2_BH20ACT2_08870 [soil metagenome]